MFSRRSTLLVLALLLGSLLLVPLPATAQDTPTIENAVAFTDTDGQFKQDHTLVEVRFDTAIDTTTVDPDNVTVSLRQGPGTVVDVYDGASANDRQFLVDLGPASTTPPTFVENVTITAGDEIENASGNAFAGGDINTAPVQSTTTTIAEGKTNRTAWRGETVALVGDDAEEGIELYGHTQRELVKRVEVPNDGQVYAVETDGLGLNRYQARFDGRRTFDPGAGDRLLELANLTVDLAVNDNPDKDDATVTDTENLTGSVSTNGVDETLSIVVRDDDETIRSTQVTTDGSGEATFDFAPLTDFDDEDWHFDLVATHLNSGVSDFYDVKVSEVDHDADFAVDSVEETRGNVFEIPVRMSPEQGDRVAVDYATVVVGSDDANYRAVVTVYDGNNDQEVELQWNTYQADGEGGAQEFAVSETDAGERDDAVTVENITTTVQGGPAEVLDAGLYELSVRSGAAVGDVTANATIGAVLEERPPAELEIYTAPAGDYDDLDELRPAISGTDQVAAGQYAVVRAKTPGLFGDLANQSDLIEYFLASDESEESGDGVELTIEEATAQANRDRKRLQADQAESVFTDETNDSIYLVVDSSTVKFMDPESELQAYWRIDEDHGLIEADETESGEVYEERTRPFSVVEPEATFQGTDDAGRLSISQAPDATPTGETTFATGTELRVRLEPESRGLRINETTVTDNRTFATSFNLTRLPVGTNFTAVVTESGTEISDRVEGQIVVGTTVTPTTEAVTTTEPEPTGTEPTTTVESTTATDPTDVETATETPVIERPTESDSETPTGTATETPGFGMLSLLVAAVGAVLLGRRESV